MAADSGKPATGPDLRWVKLAAAAGIIVAAGSLAAGITRHPQLVRFFWTPVPVAPEIAGGLLLAAVGLLLAVRGWSRATLAVGLAVALSAGFAAAHGESKGLQLLSQLFTRLPSENGPPAVAVGLESAICLLIVGLVFLLSPYWDKAWASVAGILLSLVVAATGLVAITLGATGSTWLPRHGPVTPINVHVGGGFVILGLALTAVISAARHRREPVRFPWAPLGIGATSLMVVISLCQVVAYERHAWTDEQLDHEADRFTSILHARVIGAVSSLSVELPAAPLGAGEPAGSFAEWAEDFLARHPGFVEVTRRSAQCRLLWKKTLPAYEGRFPPRDERGGVNCDSVHREAQELGFAIMHRDMSSGSHGMEVYVPFPSARRPRGYVSAVIDTAALIDEILADEPGSRLFSMAIYDENDLVYRRDREPERGHYLRSVWLRERTTRIFDATPRLEVWPTTQWLESFESPLPETIFVFGFVVTAMLGGMVHLTQKSRERARQIAELAAERRRAEEERERLFNLSLDLLCVVGPEGFLVEMNPAWRRTLGYSTEELKRLSLYELVHPDDADKTKEALKRALSGTAIDGFEARFRAKDGSYRWLLWAARSSPETRLLYAVAKDITERRAAEEELEAKAEEIRRRNDELALALAAAREATETKSRFVAAISHELRTPMTGIIGMSELLLCTNLSDEQRHWALTVKSSAESLLRIVNDILDISKLEAGRLEIIRAPFDVRLCLRGVVTLLIAHAREKGLRLATSVDAAVPPRVVGDEGRVRQVLVNLVGNAIKFTEEGGVSVTVTVEPAPASAEDRKLRFTVSDTGIGIPPDRVSQIFEEFVQADTSPARRFSGTGLGLAISKRLVEMMGGEIGCDSQPGRGSTFWFTLPLLEAAEQTHAPDKATARPAESLQYRRRVLVVEDNRVNRLVAEKMLTRLGCEVECVDSGEKAIRRLAENHYDLVLMDVNMPGMDGLETTRRIREQENGRRHTVIIAMTARAMDGDRELCLKAGMDDYISKPVTAASLRHVLERWLPAKAGQPSSEV